MAQPSTDDLADLAYAAMLGEADWQGFVDALRLCLPGGRATFFHHDPADRSGAYALTSGIDADLVASYAETYAALNPWMPGAASRPIGRGVVAEEMLAPEVLRRSAFYDGFLRPLGCRTAAGVTVERVNGRLMLLSVMTSRADPEANLDFAQTLTELCPHLRRAFAVLRRADVLGGAAADGFGLIEVGTIVVGPGGTCRAVSDAAHAIMAESGQLTVDPRGRLRWRDADIQTAMDLMLDRRREGPRHLEAVLAGDGAMVHVHLVVVQSDAISELLLGPTVLVLLDAVAARGGEADGALRALAPAFGLTAAETEVWAALVEGLAPAEIAARRGVSPETVRRQVKALFDKTGVRRQVELVRLALAPRH